MNVNPYYCTSSDQHMKTETNMGRNMFGKGSSYTIAGKEIILVQTSYWILQLFKCNQVIYILSLYSDLAQGKKMF